MIASRIARREAGPRIHRAVRVADGPLLALALWPRPDAQLKAELRSHGVEVSFAPTWQVFQAALEVLRPELLLVDSGSIDDAAALALAPHIPLIVLAEAARGAAGEPLPTFIRSALARRVKEIRARQAQQQAREQQERLELDLQWIIDMSPRINATRSCDAARQQLMVLIRDLYPAAAGGLYRYDRATDRLAAEIVLASAPIPLTDTVPPEDQAIAAWAMEHGDTLLIADEQGETGEADAGAWRADQARSVLCAPLFTRGDVWGVILLANPRSRAFTTRDLMVLRLVAAIGGTSCGGPGWSG